jgi:hypothetical protein
MKDAMEYNGYFGSVHYSDDDKVFYRTLHLTIFNKCARFPWAIVLDILIFRKKTTWGQKQGPDCTTGRPNDSPELKAREETLIEWMKKDRAKKVT